MKTHQHECHILTVNLLLTMTVRGDCRQECGGLPPRGNRRNALGQVCRYIKKSPLRATLGAVGAGKSRREKFREKRIERSHISRNTAASRSTNPKKTGRAGLRVLVALRNPWV